MPAARITGPEIAARRTCGPRLLRARPAARTGGPPDARRPRMPESCEGRAPAAVEARRRHPVPEAARGAGGASTSVCVIRGVRISCGGACHARDRRGSQLVVDARAGECASRARLPGVRSSAAGGRPSRLSRRPPRVANSPAAASFRQQRLQLYSRYTLMKNAIKQCTLSSEEETCPYGSCWLGAR